MSANVLRQSVVDEQDFPKEATFQHLIFSGLLKFTPRETSILPELSKSFASPNDSIPGALDFYIDGSLVWGLELLVNGDRIGEHIDRFGPNGKYSILGFTDYIVVDFRPSKNGEITFIEKHPKRLTVFFDLGDFTRCSCIFGESKEIVILKLNA